VTDLFTDRSRVISYQRCKRSLFLNYYFGGMGIVPARQSVALTVGGCFHSGVAYLLQCAKAFEDGKATRVEEDNAVALALAEFNQQADAGLDVEMGEALPRVTTEASADGQLYEQVVSGGQEYDAYLRAEQACLLEALVRCWARRGLPRLLAEYEVLEVEREGRWMLAERSDREDPLVDYYSSADDLPVRLWFLSRPDALLRHRQSGDLVLQSFKTTGQMDARKLRDAERDMQGLSEGVEVEQRLARQWQYAQETRAPGRQPLNAVGEWLYSLSAPPRITAIRYEYILKGERDKRSRVAKALSARVGFEARIQQSPLCYLWVKPGMTAADTEIAHSFGWTDASGKERKLAWQSWNQAPVWEHTTVGAWIDLLDAGTVQPEAGRDVLSEQLVPPVLVYRQDDDLRDMIEQVEAQEVEVQRDLMAVNAAVGEDGKRSALNQRFPQTRTACSYPGECAYVPICYGGADIRRDPMGSGKYKARVPNHPQELTQIEVTYE
jgi:hypothetical protein